MDADLREVRDRTRRIETRLTQALIVLGVDTHAQKPSFLHASPIENRPATLRLPSPHTSFKEAMAALPADWTGPVRVCIGADAIGTFTPDRS